jgi:succinate dehydrogenase / fumarate reductase, membrane anchor subunit
VDGSGGEHRADPSRLDAAFLMVLLLIALFSHLALGLQVVIEDYVHSWVKIPTLLAVRFACFALGPAGILATLRIAFGP